MKIHFTSLVTYQAVIYFKHLPIIPICFGFVWYTIFDGHLATL